MQALRKVAVVARSPAVMAHTSSPGAGVPQRSHFSSGHCFCSASARWHSSLSPQATVPHLDGGDGRTAGSNKKKLETEDGGLGMGDCRLKTGDWRLAGGGLGSAD